MSSIEEIFNDDNITTDAVPQPPKGEREEIHVDEILNESKRAAEDVREAIGSNSINYSKRSKKKFQNKRKYFCNTQ